MKGIILAGGSGSRLYPMTFAVSKQLLPIYDKPMIFYSLTTLLMAGIKDILIITSSSDLDRFKILLGDGKRYGVKIDYIVQPKPQGIAQAFIIGSDFIKQDSCTLILGDNLFFGTDIKSIFKTYNNSVNGSVIFSYEVKDPERYGVVHYDKNGKIISIDEKPKLPKSNKAVTGLYIYDNEVVNMAKNLKPSNRGELEITDINNQYLLKNKLHIEELKPESTWLDTGTPNALLEASHFVQSTQSRKGLLVGSPDEVAFKNGWIGIKEIRNSIKIYNKSNYANYLKNLLKNNFLGD
jgi:glucose-1-phosphate thymidylyltransferase